MVDGLLATVFIYMCSLFVFIYAFVNAHSTDTKFDKIINETIACSYFLYIFIFYSERLYRIGYNIYGHNQKLPRKGNNTYILVLL